jgi:hypothetical protein
LVLASLLPGSLAARQERASPRGSIVGRVVSSLTNLGIPEARIEIVGGNRVVLAGESGNYRVDSIPVGNWPVRVSAIGFEPLLLADVLVGSGKPVELDLRLLPAVVRLQDISVEVPYFAPGIESNTSTESLSADEVRTAPGVLEDVVRAVALFPGVAVTTGGRNDLAVRGGAPYENLFVVDGLEVPNINHFGTQGSTGGTTSIIASDLIREATFSSGGFGVQYGDRTASLTSLSIREGNRERLAGEVNLSATGFGAIGEGPLGKNGSFLVSVRRSYLDLVFRLLDFSFIPGYWDAQFKLTQRFGNRHSLSLLAGGTLDQVTLNEATADDRVENSLFASPDQKSYFTGITWSYALSRGLLSVTLGRTWTRFTTSQVDTLLVPVYLNRSEEADNSFRAQVTWEFRHGLQVTAGNSLRYADQLQYEVLLAGEYRTDSLNQPRPLAVDTAFTALRNATYAQAAWQVGNLQLTAGLRGEWYGFLDAYRLAPRLGASIAVGRSGSINVSVGRYYQAPQFIWLVGDPQNVDRLEPIRADVAIVGYDRLLRSDLKARVEVYYRVYGDYAARLFRPQAVLQPSGFDDVTSDIPSGLEPLESIGTGRSYGAELLLQKRFSTIPLYGLMSITFNRSQFAGLDSVYYTGGFETRFVGNLLAGWRFNPQWEVSGKFRVATGMPYTPFAEFGPLQGERDFNRYNQLNLSTFSALDVRVDRRWAFRSVQLDVYIDIQNLLGRRNVIGTFWDPRAQRGGFDTGLGVLPSIGVSVEF